MNTVQIALLVAGITGGAGIVQGTIQSNAVRAGLRAEIIRENIKQLEDLRAVIQNAGNKANAYILHLPELPQDSEGRLDDSGWRERWAFLDPLLDMQGQLQGISHSVNLDKDAKDLVQKVANLMGSLTAVNCQTKEIVTRWNNESPLIRSALEKVSQEIRLLQGDLQRVNWWFPIRKPAKKWSRYQTFKRITDNNSH